MECRERGVGIRLARVYDSATTTCVKTFVTYIKERVRTPNILAADVFGTGIFHGHQVS
jgi:hypothetical protein